MMMKNTCLLILLLAFSFTYGQTTLSEGDIAITGVNADGSDQFSFVLLTDITNGTQIKFTDFGWISTGGFYNLVNEGVVTWTASSPLSCGSEIIIESIGSGNFSASTGTAIQTDANFSLAANGDQLIVYQGTLSNPTFLYAIHFGNNNGWSNASDTNTSDIPAGLTNGVNALDMGNYDNGVYNCFVTSNQSLILGAITEVSNWTRHNTTRQSLGLCSFTCSAPTTCSSTVTWNGSWSGGSPDLTTEVIIASSYNTNLGSFRACNLTINSGIDLTVNDNSFVEVQNNVIVNGTLNVETQGNFVQNDDSGIFTVNPGGSANVNKTTPAKQEWFHYTYWSSPVSGQTIDNAFPSVEANRRFWFNAANFLDEDGDNVDDDKNDWTVAYGAGNMTPGLGYAATASRFHFPGANDAATFTGPFNTGNIPVSISYDSRNTEGSWNFIGNPYPCAIDFIAFQAANSTVIDGVVYLWSQATLPNNSNSGNEQINFSANDYATFTIGTGGAAGGDITQIPNGYIASGQGFFIASLSNGNATFTNAMRMADGTSNTQFFKGARIKNNTSSNINNKLWLNLTSDNGVFNQILVGYVDGATNNDDGYIYDAPKLSTNQAATLFTSIENSNQRFVIQGKSPSSLNENEIIPLGFDTSIEVPTTYTLSIPQFEGSFFNTNAIYLKDNLINITHNLSESDYNFTSEKGEFNERFEVVFNANALSKNEYILNNNQLSIILLDNNHVEFSVTNSTIKSISIFDLIGKELYSLEGKLSSNIYDLSTLKNNVYIAKIELSNGSVISKKIKLI